jgi:cold shock CspA family protein
MDDKRITGRIIKVSRLGWGFISSKEIEFTRIFFHWTALQQNTLPFLELKTGMKVEFTPIAVPDKGYRAIHVTVIDKKVFDEKNRKDEDKIDEKDKKNDDSKDSMPTLHE